MCIHVSDICKFGHVLSWSKYFQFVIKHNSTLIGVQVLGLLCTGLAVERYVIPLLVPESSCYKYTSSRAKFSCAVLNVLVYCSDLVAPPRPPWRNGPGSCLTCVTCNMQHFAMPEMYPLTNTYLVFIFIHWNKFTANVLIMGWY